MPILFPVRHFDLSLFCCWNLRGRCSACWLFLRETGLLFFENRCGIFLLVHRCTVILQCYVTKWVPFAIFVFLQVIHLTHWTTLYLLHASSLSPPFPYFLQLRGHVLVLRTIFVWGSRRGLRRRGGWFLLGYGRLLRLWFVCVDFADFLFEILDLSDTGSSTAFELVDLLTEFFQLFAGFGLGTDRIVIEVENEDDDG